MKNIRLILLFVLIGIIAASLIQLSQKYTSNIKFDATEEKIYTLTDGTTEIIKNINKPITLKFYYSQKASTKLRDQDRSYTDYYYYIHSLLAEYASKSNGMIKLEEIDPQRFSPEEEDAIRFGIYRAPINQDEGFYFGLVAQSSLGRIDTIAHFHPARQRHVEYDISSLISRLIGSQRKRIGVITSMPIFSREKGWVFLSLLNKRYDIVQISPRVTEIKDVDLLMLIHPRRLAPETIFAIDQFIVKGNPCMMFVDPFCVADEQGRKLNIGYSQINRLTGPWGVELLTDFFAGDRQLAQEVTVDRGTNYGQLIPLVGLNGDCFNQSLAATANMAQINLLFPGVLRKLDPKPESIKIEPLLQTTPQGSPWKVSDPRQLQKIDYLKLSGYQLEDFQRVLARGSKPVPMAYYLHGQFPSNFPDNNNAVKATPPDKESRLAVFADVDMLSNEVAHFDSQGQPLSNINLIESTIDFLLDSDSLIAARNRGSFTRPFIKIQELQAQAQQQAINDIENIKAQLIPIADELRAIKRKTLANSPDVTPKDYAQKLNQYRVKEAEVIRLIRQIELDKNQQIETIGLKWRNANMFIAPAFILLIAIMLVFYRRILYMRQVNSYLSFAAFKLSPRQYRDLAILTVVAMAMSSLVFFDNISNTKGDNYVAKGLLLQGLDIDNVTLVQVSNQGISSTIVFDADGNPYLKNKGNYPADAKKVNEMLAGWLGIQTVSFITDDPQAHEAMSLSDNNPVQSIKFYNLDEKGDKKLIAGVLTGKTSEKAGGVFVRLLNPDGSQDNNVYVANDVPTSFAKAQSFMERHILYVTEKDIISAEFKEGENHIRLFSDIQGNITPRGFASEAKVNFIACRKLLYLPIEMAFIDVWPTDDTSIKDLDFNRSVEYCLVDQMVLKIDLAQRQGKVYMRCSGRFEPIDPDITQGQREQMEAATQAFNTYHRRWIYQLNDEQGKILSSTVETLTEN
ncbi:MAG: Gldg family protein [Phycisphaerae bacterium]|nr:Gldg family protein [Phycisphaerae bacterium]